VIEAADADIPLRKRIGPQDVGLERGNIVRELEELLADLVEGFEILLAQSRLRHGLREDVFTTWGVFRKKSGTVEEGVVLMLWWLGTVIFLGREGIGDTHGI
jgi:hypothetical protein